MVHHPISALPLPQAKIIAMTTSCFQSQNSADKNLRKSLKNKNLYPNSQFSAARLQSVKPPQGPDDRCADVRRVIRCRMGRGLYGSMGAAPYALSAAAWRHQRCGLSIDSRSPLFKRGAGSKGGALRLCLVPTIQSEGEAFQCGALDYVGSKKRPSCWGYATEKGRSQPPYMEGKPGASIGSTKSGDPCERLQQGGILMAAAHDVL